LKNESEVTKVEIVGPVNTTTENPWRTREEYNQEQALILKSFRWSMAASIAAVITAVCTIILAITAISEIKNISQQSQSQKAQKLEKHKEK